MILSLYDIRTEIYSQNDSDEKIVLVYVQPISDANGELSLVKNIEDERCFFSSEK